MANSFVKMDTEILMRPDLTMNSKVLFCLIKFFDRGRGCWARKSLLAHYLNSSLPTIRKGLLELVEKDLISVTKRGPGKTDLIRVINDEKVKQPVVAADAPSETNEVDLQVKDTLPKGERLFQPHYNKEIEVPKIEFISQIVETHSQPLQSNPVVKESRSAFYGLKKCNDTQEWKRQNDTSLYGKPCTDASQYLAKLRARFSGNRK